MFSICCLFRGYYNEFTPAGTGLYVTLCCYWASQASYIKWMLCVCIIFRAVAQNTSLQHPVLKCCPLLLIVSCQTSEHDGVGAVALVLPFSKWHKAMTFQNGYQEHQRWVDSRWKLDRGQDVSWCLFWWHHLLQFLLVPFTLCWYYLIFLASSLSLCLIS